MLRRADDGARREAGFTLVELLVVILIVGILAAIAIPAFLNQRHKAYDADAKATLRTAQTAEEVYATDHDGAYVSETLAAGDNGPLATIEPSLRNRPYVTAIANGKVGYTLSATSDGSQPDTFTVSVATGSVSRTCSPAGSGGCGSGGTW